MATGSPPSCRSPANYSRSAQVQCTQKSPAILRPHRPPHSNLPPRPFPSSFPPVVRVCFVRARDAESYSYSVTSLRLKHRLCQLYQSNKCRGLLSFGDGCAWRSVDVASERRLYGTGIELIEPNVRGLHTWTGGQVLSRRCHKIEWETRGVCNGARPYTFLPILNEYHRFGAAAPDRTVDGRERCRPAFTILYNHHHRHHPVIISNHCH